MRSSYFASQLVKTAAIFAAVFLSTPCFAQAGANTAAGQVYDLSLVDLGKKVYVPNCTRCHGLNMVASGAGFFDLRTFPPNEKPRFFESITKGKRAMPAWGGNLKPEEIEALWSYVMAGQKK